MYKDPDKQREANRMAQAKFKAKGITNKPQSGITLPEKTDLGNTLTTTQTVGAVIPKGVTDERSNEPSSVIPERGAYNDMQRTKHALNEALGKPKRGKDIKTFADLPPDVQQTIDMMSMVHDKIDETTKANRTAIAIHYQHLFPGRYHSVGVA